MNNLYAIFGVHFSIACAMGGVRAHNAFMAQLKIEQTEWVDGDRWATGAEERYY